MPGWLGAHIWPLSAPTTFNPDDTNIRCHVTSETLIAFEEFGNAALVAFVERLRETTRDSLRWVVNGFFARDEDTGEWVFLPKGDRHDREVDSANRLHRFHLTHCTISPMPIGTWCACVHVCVCVCVCVCVQKLSFIGQPGWL